MALPCVLVEVDTVLGGTDSTGLQAKSGETGKTVIGSGVILTVFCLADSIYQVVGHLTFGAS